MRTLIRTGVLAVAIGLVAAGCGSDSDAPSSSSTTTATPAKVTGNITVSIAASLTEAFEQIRAEFEAANPGASVTLNPGSSTTLATQIAATSGNGVDTFASADEANMDKLVTANLIDGRPVVFARNQLVIVTKPGNPKDVKTLADLADLDVVSLCGETVPCGKYATEVLANAGVTIPETKVTRGTDVKVTLGAVTNGDAEAAIVYLTDAISAPVDKVTIPSADNVIARYPIATLAASGNPGTSRAFIDDVMSSRGQATLGSYGFLPPS